MPYLRDYAIVKAATLESFSLTQEGYSKKFRESEAQDDEAPQQFTCILYLNARERKLVKSKKSNIVKQE